MAFPVVDVKVEEEDVLVRPPGFKKQKAMPASSVVVKKKGTYSSSVVGPLLPRRR